MKFNKLMLFCAVIALSFVSNSFNAEEKIDSATYSKNYNEMNSYVSIVEIPASDFDRAQSFYSNILGLEVQKFAFEGMEMGFLPFENQSVVVSISKGEGFVPSAEGVTVYLNAGEDLQPVLDKVESNGGKVLLGKTPHADNSGFFALFLDSEGNRLGLNSLK